MKISLIAPKKGIPINACNRKLVFFFCTLRFRVIFWKILSNYKFFETKRGENREDIIFFFCSPRTRISSWPKKNLSLDQSQYEKWLLFRLFLFQLYNNLFEPFFVFVHHKRARTCQIEGFERILNNSLLFVPPARELHQKRREKNLFLNIWVVKKSSLFKNRWTDFFLPFLRLHSIEMADYAIINDFIFSP